MTWLKWLKYRFRIFKFRGVGRGVLRFWTVRYRKPRSNLVGFCVFGGILVSGGVDII